MTLIIDSNGLFFVEECSKNIPKSPVRELFGNGTRECEIQVCFFALLLGSRVTDAFLAAFLSELPREKLG